MKSVLAMLGCLLAMICVAAGQAVTVQVVFDQDQYLVGESVIAKVRITNDSGQVIQLGQDDEWVSFVVEDSHHFVVPRRGTIPVKGPFRMEPSTIATKRVDLAPYFDISQIGRYSVQTMVHVAQWAQSFQSRPATFDVIRGSSIWEKEFGVPTKMGAAGGIPETRRYSLVQTIQSKTNLLYFRLSDTRDLRVYRMYPLGQMVSFSKLEPQLDSYSNLHVLFQTGGRTFMHCLMTPDGLLMTRETYEYTESRPVLRPQPDGRIKVEGGVRRISSNDVPPPMPAKSPSDAKPN